MSTNYDSQYPPPPGQGYYSAQPNPPRESRRHRRSRDGSVSPRSTQDYYDRGTFHETSEPKRGSEAPQEDFTPPNQLTPYDEEKAYAEWNRAYGPESAYQNAYVPVDVPVSEPPRRHARRRSLDDRSRRYEADRDFYDDMSVDRQALPRRRRRRRDSTHSVSDYQSKPEKKDLAPTLMASAAGAFLGRKMVSKGPLGILGGAIAGALGANAGEHLDERKRRREQRRDSTRRDEDDRYYRERDEDRRRSRRTESPRSDMRDSETVYSRRRPRDLSRRPRTKRYVGSSPDSRLSV